MMRRMLVSALALAGVAHAQNSAPHPDAAPGLDCAPGPTCTATPPASPSERVAYDAAFFSQYSPQTALDMVRQTPGFTLDGGDDRRGFSGAVGNLLIDGLRPSAKSQSLDTILSQIPAAQVVRVELLRGADVAGDASGQSVLLNVVRTASAGGGLWNVTIGQHGESIRPYGDASYSGRNGQIEYGIGASWYQDTRDQPGHRELFDSDGSFQGSVLTPSPRNYREGAINANLAAPLLGGRISATGQASWYRWHAAHQFLSFDPSGANFENLHDDFTETRPRPSYEIGLNYDRDFGPWALALVGLTNGRDYQSDETATTTNGAGAILSIIDVGVRRDGGESILRGTLSRQLSPGHRAEFGIEGALNTLDASLDITEDAGSGPVALSIPNSNVSIEEERAEAFLVHTWRPNQHWSIESRLAWETSTLTFTGDSNQVVDLAFWKPSLQLTRSFGESNQAHLRLYRDVGQLNFDDFVSAAGIADDLIDGGNPDLAPETSWRAEIGTDMRFAGGGALGLTLTQYWIEEVADVVQVIAPGPPEVRFDAPGNIGDAQGTRLDANLTLPLSGILPGGRVTISGYLWRGEVTDPVTGRMRDLSNHPESQLDLELRQDIASRRLAWSISLSKQGEYQFYRFNEIDTQEDGPWVDAYIESSALPHGMRLRLSAQNIFDGEILRSRRFFEGDRNGPLDRFENRLRHFIDSPWYQIRLSGSF